MFGFGYAMVPMYRLICEATGIKGTNASMRIEQAAVPAQVDKSRTVTVEFLGTLNQGLTYHWEFRPEQPKIQVHPGELVTVKFFAKNNSDTAVIAQAIPSVAPWEATRFLRKTECFCFTQQHFAPG